MPVIWAVHTCWRRCVRLLLRRMQRVLGNDPAITLGGAKKWSLPGRRARRSFKRMASTGAAAIATVLLIAACQLPGSAPTCDAQIDWVNFIQVGSTQYVAGPQSPTILQESDLGPVYAHVKFKVSGNVCDPNYRLKDGDAAFLDVGTPIYQVNGHLSSDQLAAKFNGSLVVYRALTPAP